MAGIRKNLKKTLVSKKRIHSFLKRSQAPFQQTLLQKGARLLFSHSAEETSEFAKCLGKGLSPGTVVALQGPIGSGKTVFIKGLAKGLGVKKSEDVKSPTFVLLHVYEGRMSIYHFDLYRLEKEKELDALGFDEYVTNPETISFVEWADRAKKRVPKNAVWVKIEITGPSSRKIILK
jgi:tRNA threonylcarbamoyladenosine biosynthesis protein TsaE